MIIGKKCTKRQTSSLPAARIKKRVMLNTVRKPQRTTRLWTSGRIQQRKSDCQHPYHCTGPSSSCIFLEDVGNSGISLHHLPCLPSVAPTVAQTGRAASPGDTFTSMRRMGSPCHPPVVKFVFFTFTKPSAHSKSRPPRLSKPAGSQSNGCQSIQIPQRCKPGLGWTHPPLYPAAI